PETYKEYSDSRKAKLPDPVLSQNMSLDRTLRMRKSIRHFSSEPVTWGQLSYLLWASTGIQRVERGFEFRPVPSAGALYPIETYLVVNNVEGLTQGVYHYSIRGHLLDELKLGDYSKEAASTALGQRMCATAAVVFIWGAVFYRSKWKYEQRAYRYIYLDAGHMAQNLALATVSLGLGSCQIAALYDDEANSMVGVDGIEESVIYMTAVGQPR
ncbi:MAG: SagB/ThcOx family dehydrogenase, partial [Candidatus Hydrothermarchaeota archaeon]|nr:SagB/ThcOx family dehydrogenase [Candidatus Hydrothermarchaeota archaeon]